MLKNHPAWFRVALCGAMNPIKISCGVHIGRNQKGGLAILAFVNSLRRWRIFIRLGFTLQVIKAAFAAGASWFLATFVSANHYPYFAPLAAILTVQVTIADTVQKATYRIVGIILGVILSMFVGHYFHIGALSISLIVLIGMAIPTAFRLNPQITSQVAVSSLLVLAFGHQPGYALSRIVETILGSGVAIIINALVVPLNVIPLARQSLFDLSAELATTLRNVRVSVANVTYTLNEDIQVARAVVSHTEKTAKAVQLSKQSLRYTPFYRKRREDLQQLSVAITRLNHITIQVRGIARGFADLGTQLTDNPGLTSALEATASCIAIFGETFTNPSNETMDRLKVAVAVAHTRQAFCLASFQKSSAPTVLLDVGGIFTDMSRILREVVVDAE